jgi:DNA-binding beta-propeller fold protein YncE
LVAQPAIAIAGANGRFDFIEVDEGMDRLLASHTGNGTLDVFALGTGALIRKVPVGAAQAVAIDAAGGNYYVTCSAEKQVAVVDRKTLAKTGTIAVSGPPDLIALDTRRGHLYAGHDDANEIWVCEPKSRKVVATITFPSGEGPEGIVYDREADRVYQTVKTDDSILEIDPASNSVKARWSTAPAKSPHGLALDARRHRLFSAGANGQLAVLDAQSGQRVAAVDIASGVDQIAFDPAKDRVYCGSRDGVVSVVQETASGATLIENVKSAPGAKSIAVDPKRHDVWTCYGSPQASYLMKLVAP